MIRMRICGQGTTIAAHDPVARRCAPQPVLLGFVVRVAVEILGQELYAALRGSLSRSTVSRLLGPIWSSSNRHVSVSSCLPPQSALIATLGICVACIQPSWSGMISTRPTMLHSTMSELCSSIRHQQIPRRPRQAQTPLSDGSYYSRRRGRGETLSGGLWDVPDRLLCSSTNAGSSDCDDAHSGGVLINGRRICFQFASGNVAVRISNLHARSWSNWLD